MNGDLYKSLSPEEKAFADLLLEILRELKSGNSMLSKIVGMEEEYKKTL